MRFNELQEATCNIKVKFRLYIWYRNAKTYLIHSTCIGAKNGY